MFLQAAFERPAAISLLHLGILVSGQQPGFEEVEDDAEQQRDEHDQANDVGLRHGIKGLELVGLPAPAVEDVLKGNGVGRVQVTGVCVRAQSSWASLGQWNGVVGRCAV